ncbi:MAG: hypothetical protein A3C61_01225 [Candidatus Yanofskybacteria bacterium RIFCSPHIGHO2_02_FULL_39_10]|uniref:Uncharacterized protein n=1 Tax=Candidatus Yanofskybacteria bacterium RIFCSPHIGHO2_02_FULL_39_10 TaxID=1802674 RepID=A0A1F8FB12_9BACT|nr:MAG: hypothetical protein A3C61_01225 [Candidatus Yanofskybacteria bacterium RIFCSPHIGHO2_02_FULL_39_10]
MIEEKYVRPTITDEEFEKIRSNFELGYKAIKEVRCPYFTGPVVFNAMGLEHLKFMRKNHARPRNEQLLRMRLFPLAPEIVSLSQTIQGITYTKHFENLRTNQRYQSILLPVYYYEFVAILKDKRVRVVIKQIEDGPRFFWSIIPFWKIDKNTNRRKMSYGNPEID